MHWVLIRVMTKKLNLLPTMYVGVRSRRGGGNVPIVHGSSKDSKDSKVSPEVTRSSPCLSFFICGVSIYYVRVNMFVLVAWTASVSPLIACLPNRWLVSALHIGEEHRLLSSTLGHLHLPRLGWSRACTLHWAKPNQNRHKQAICIYYLFVFTSHSDGN